MKAKFLHIASLVILILPFGTVFAQEQQEDNEVKSLGEILNPQEKGYSADLSTKERGNIYFKRCMATESLAFDEEEKELLCACTAAKLGEIITAPEFVELYKDTEKGEKARMKVITYAYTECIDYALSKKVYKDCRVLPSLKTIPSGKNNVCECVVKQHNNLMSDASTAHLIMEGIKYSPMTLNPLERYFVSDGYYGALTRYVKLCRSRMLYNRNN